MRGESTILSPRFFALFLLVVLVLLVLVVVLLIVIVVLVLVVVLIVALHRASLLSEVLLQAVVWTAERKNIQAREKTLYKPLYPW